MELVLVQVLPRMMALDCGDSWSQIAWSEARRAYHWLCDIQECGDVVGGLGGREAAAKVESVGTSVSMSKWRSGSGAL